MKTDTDREDVMQAVNESPHDIDILAKQMEEIRQYTDTVHNIHGLVDKFDAGHGLRLAILESLADNMVGVAITLQRIVEAHGAAIDNLDQKVDDMIEYRPSPTENEGGKVKRDDFFMGVDIGGLDEQLWNTASRSDRKMLLRNALMKASKRH